MVVATENRRRILRLLPAGVVVLAVPWLSGCAEQVELGSEPVPGITPASSPRTPAGMAELYLLNDLMTGSFGILKSSAKIVNGNGRRALVDVKPKRYARFFMSPGPHTLKLREPSGAARGDVWASMTVDATPGTTYYVVAKLHFSFEYGPRFFLDQVSASEARALMQQMTPQ